MLECVVNVSEGCDHGILLAIEAAAGSDLLDFHRDAHHNRSVLTLVGTGAVRAVTAEAVARIDLRAHDGVHPRIGVVDVVPFVALDGSTGGDARRARDAYAAWAAAELGLPCFLYGPERTLPEVRRGAFTSLVPDVGPPTPHPTAGAVATGVRGLLIAYNLWLAEPDLAAARAIARAVRGPAVRALGLPVGDRVQVSLNLVAPDQVGPADAWDLVAARAAVAGAELVGLVPERVLRTTPTRRWTQLDLGADRTIEARLEERTAR